MGFRLMQTEEALRLVTEDLFEQLAEDGVIYAELRFAPLLHLERGLSAERVVDGGGTADGGTCRATGVEARLILCTLRHFNPGTEHANRAPGRAVSRQPRRGARYRGRRGRISPRCACSRRIRHAREQGAAVAPRTPARPAERKACGKRCACSIRSASATARAALRTRLLVEHLRREKIHLELCPSSNVQIIPSIASWEEHPIDRLYKAGVSAQSEYRHAHAESRHADRRIRRDAADIWLGQRQSFCARI